MSVYLIRSLLLSLFIAIFITVCFYFLRKESKPAPAISFNSSPKAWSASITVHASRASFTDNQQAFKEALTANLSMTESRLRSAGFQSGTELKNDSTYIISVYSLTDTTAIHDLITSNTQLSFHEVYTLNELAPPLQEMPQDLYTIFSPAQASENTAGFPRYPAYIGMCAAVDSGKLRSFFTDGKVLSKFPADIQFLFGEIDERISSPSPPLLFYAVRKKPNALSNKQIKHIESTYDQRNLPVLDFTFDDAGTERWEKMTEQNIGKPIAMCINEKVIYAPLVMQKITGGQCRIAMGSKHGPNPEATRILGVLLKSGPLLLPATITETRFTSLAPTPAKKLSPTMSYLLVFGVSLAISFCIIWFIFRPGKNAGANRTHP